MEPTQNVVTGRSAAPSPFRRPPQPTPLPSPTMSARVATAPVVTAPGPLTASAEHLQLEARRRRGALWFYWVAALSLINAAVVMAGAHWRFIVGLGFTQVATGLAARAGRGWTALILLDLLVIGGFVLLGTLALHGALWAFGVGIGLYAADGLIFLLARSWVGLAFHALVLVFIFKGFEAARQLKARRA